MLTRVDPQDWQPVDIEDLERNAWKALRHEGSTLVVAGPGAGKTEFLAQRAAYLLQTGLCPEPYRVLAISFKVDAAQNLARRVKARCTEGEARRFVSLTFDAFTKGLVDRFSAALPEYWQLTRPYEVFLAKDRDIRAFLGETRQLAPSQWTGEVETLRSRDFESRTIGRQRLTTQSSVPNSGAEFAAQRWWHERFRGTPSTPTFTCLNRLAELAIRTNGQLQKALRVTYPFVFVDEFQDTTYSQYDFLSSVFFDSGVQITAVGDDKQRIMAWAGAQEDVFAQFEADFSADRIPLLKNHRSSPSLVRVQQVVAQAIDATTSPVESTVEGEIVDGVAQVWRFPTPVAEARTVANWLESDMAVRGKHPRDYALLVRQQADVLEEQLRPEFDGKGIQLRNENRALGRTTLQDLLADEAMRVALALLRLGAHTRYPEAWDRVADALPRLRAIDPDDSGASQKEQDGLTAFVQSIRSALQEMPNLETANSIADRIFEFLDPVAMRSVYAEHATGDGLDIVMEAFRLHLEASAADSNSWTRCLDLFEGQDSTPVMTVHKSKSLEYDTVVFMGLDDESWWSHRPGRLDGLSTFFVGLSRAEQRVIFTYCEGRGRAKIADLYQLLSDAGVPEVARG